MKQKDFSIWSAFDVELSPEDMVLELEKRGLRLCELSDEHGDMLLKRGGDPAQIGAAFRAFAAEHGVSFPQGHLWLAVRLCDTTRDVIGILKNWLRLFAAIGIKNAVLHCDSSSFPKGTDAETIIAANAEALKKLTPLAEELRIRICLENLLGVFHDATVLNRVIDLVGSPALGICLDTGHLNIAHHGTQASFILAAGQRLHALHLADNEGATDQHMMPFGRGNVDFRAVMYALDAVSYDGLINYEIPGERFLPMCLRKAKTDYLRTVTDYLLSL